MSNMPIPAGSNFALKNYCVPGRKELERRLVGVRRDEKLGCSFFICHFKLPKEYVARKLGAAVGGYR